MNRRIKLAIIDNAVDHRLYTPVEHWAQYLPVPWESFEAGAGRLPRWNEGFSHFILTGSEASILDREVWAEAEAEFVREAVRRQAAILASCWGHQLLAYSLLGPAGVRRCRRPEIGWIPVDIHAPSEILGGPGQAFSFSLHFDEVADTGGRFDVLASSPICPVQAMALKNSRVWGFQIHPEININSALTLLKNLAGLNPGTDPLYSAALRSEPRDSGLIRTIVKFFLDS
ncbi:MAG: hypothetical protein MUP19_08890 [Candidatus Aminicenantes bacterium]|nr:hypothetical protein [Candidatus Aminicenantes bacterium]